MSVGSVSSSQSQAAAQGAPGSQAPQGSFWSRHKVAILIVGCAVVGGAAAAALIATGVGASLIALPIIAKFAWAVACGMMIGGTVGLGVGVRLVVSDSKKIFPPAQMLPALAEKLKQQPKNRQDNGSKESSQPVASANASPVALTVPAASLVPGEISQKEIDRLAQELIRARQESAVSESASVPSIKPVVSSGLAGRPKFEGEIPSVIEAKRQTAVAAFDAKHVKPSEPKRPKPANIEEEAPAQPLWVPKREELPSENHPEGWLFTGMPISGPTRSLLVASTPVAKPNYFSPEGATIQQYDDNGSKKPDGNMVVWEEPEKLPSLPPKESPTMAAKPKQ